MENIRLQVMIIHTITLIDLGIIGIIVAGGEWQNKAKLIKLDSQEDCDLPDPPHYFDWASMDLLNGTPVLCGSWFGSPANSRRK